VNGEPSARGGLRTTRQRAAVTGLLDTLDGFASAQEVHEHLRRRGERVGLSTVYRTLTALAESGEVDVLRTDVGEAVYRRCSTGHHHHLVCRSCGRTVEVEGPAVERWAARIGAEFGYVDVSHTIEVFGTCGTCAAG
jgi:Fur family ferric uptake transcriptional regulator